MSTATLELDGDRRGYSPRETVSGRASWSIDENPTSAEVRLFWYTQGKGTQDVEIVSVTTFDHAQRMDRRSFQIALPAGPYGYAGKLVGIVWALELIVEPGTIVDRVELEMGPGGRPVTTTS